MFELVNHLKFKKIVNYKILELFKYYNFNIKFIKSYDFFSKQISLAVQATARQTYHRRFVA
jgi:hypothetical protein